MSKKERYLLAVAGLCVVALLLLLALPLLTGRVYADSDLENFFIPVRDFYAECLRRGHDFRWLPYEFTGFYLHGEGQFGLTHPLNLFSYRFLPLGIALNLEVLRNYVFPLIGSCWFLARWGLPYHACVLGALLFAFSGFNVLHFAHLNLVAATAHLPLSLVALDFLFRGTSQRQVRLGGLGLLILSTSLILIGHPQAVWMCLLVEGLYASWLAWSVGARGRLAAAFAIQILALASAGIQAVPVWESLQTSSRAAPPDGFRDTLSVAPLGLLQLIQPYLYVVGKSTFELATYAGSVAPIFVVWLAMRRSRVGAAWPLARASLALALLGVLLCLGPSGWVYRIQGLVPVLQLFRAPSRYILLFHAALAVVAAVAFADIVRGAVLTRRMVLIVLAVPLTSLLISVAATIRPDAFFAGELSVDPTIWIGPILVGVCAVGVLLAARGSTVAAIVVVALAAADVGAYSLSYVLKTDIVTLRDFRDRTPLPSGALDYRIFLGPPALMMRGVRMTWGYVAMFPDRNLMHSGRPPGRHPDWSRRVTAALRASSVSRVGGRPIESPLPRARLATKARVSTDPLRDIADIDLETTALVDSPVTLESGSPGTATIAYEVPGEIRIVTRASGRQLLVLAESYHEGWKWTVDGVPRSPLRVYGDFMGTVLDAGEHEVELDFRPRSFRLGAWMSAIALVLGMLGCWLVPLRIRR